MAEPKRITPILIHYDYWDHNGDRHPAGSVVNVSVETAKALLSEGKAERADPLPGED
jgi:hypothetical protein